MGRGSFQIQRSQGAWGLSTFRGVRLRAWGSELGSAGLGLQWPRP